MPMNSRYFITALLVVILSIPGYAQKYNCDNIPDSLTQNAHAIVRLDSTRIEIRNNEFTKYVTYVITVRSEKGDEFASFTEDYDSYSHFYRLNAVLYDKDGKEIQKKSRSDFNDISAFGISNTFLQDDRYKIFDFQYRTYPYTVKYEYEKKYKSVFFLPTWQAQGDAGIAVEKAVLEVNFPYDNRIRYKCVNFKEHDNSYLSKSFTATQECKWVFTNMKAFEYQPYSRTFQLQKPFIQLSVKKISLENYEGTTSTWNGFGNFFYNLNKDKDILSAQSIKQVEALTKDVTDEKKKVEILYKYLQKNTRYVLNTRGILGWQSIAAEKVHESGYGDCKGLSNYMKAMLKATGIKSYQTLVYAGDKLTNVMDVDFPTNSFNHVILCVPLEKDTVWLECTSNVFPAGYLGAFTHDRNVLILTEDGGQIAKTPAYDKSDSYLNRNISLNVDFEKPVQNIIWKSDYAGDMAEDLLNTAANKAQKAFEESVSASAPYKNFKLKTIALEHAVQLKNAPVIKEVAEYEVEHLITETKSRYLLSLPIMSVGLPDIETESGRTAPFIFPSGMKINYNYTIAYPNSVVPENIPKAIVLNHPFGSYLYQPELSENKITFHIVFLINDGTYDADQYANYLKFYKTAISNTKQITLSFLKK